MELSLTSRDLTWLKLLAILATLHGLLYALLIPPWQAPDEDAHFVASYMYAYTGRLPTQVDVPPSLIQAVSEDLLSRNFNLIRGRPSNARGNDYGYMARTVERYSPAYALYGVAILPFLNQSLIFQFYMMRLVSVVIGVAIISLTYLSLRLLHPEGYEVAIGAAISLIFWPQHAFINSSINDGNLAELFATLTFYSMILLFKLGFKPKWLLLALISLTLALISKYINYFFAPLLGIVLADYLLRTNFFRHLNLAKPSGWVRLGGLSLFVAFWGWLLFYRFDLLQFIFVSSDVGELVLERFSSGALMTYYDLLFDSFWVVLGWLNIRLDEIFYSALEIFSVVLVTGWILKGRHLYRKNHNATVVSFLELALVLNFLMLLILMLVFVNGADYRQGRFLFATSLPFSLIFTGGWLGWFSHTRRGLGLKSWFVLWGLVDAMILFGLILIRFYPIPFSR